MGFNSAFKGLTCSFKKLGYIIIPYNFTQRKVFPHYRLYIFYRVSAYFRFSDSSIQFVPSISIDTVTAAILTFRSNVSVSRVALILKVISSRIYWLKFSFYYACYLSCQTNFLEHIAVKILREGYER